MLQSKRLGIPPHIQATVSSLLSSADDASRGRLLASQRKESDAWLSAPPVSSLGLRMDNHTVRIAVGLCLGTPLCSPHQCASCGDHVDSSGTHGLHCRRSAGHLPRHSALNNLVKRSLSSIEVPSILEPPGLFRSDGRCVDGVSVIPWQAGRPLAWDVTCCDTFAPTYKSLAASGAGSVANVAEHMQEDTAISGFGAHTCFRPHCHRNIWCFWRESSCLLQGDW